MTRAVEFTVRGVAQPAGSKRALPRGGRRGSRPVVVDDAKGSKAWKTTVAIEARVAMMGRELLDGPLALDVVFWMPRPKGHYGASGLRSSAPVMPTVKPDATKLLRAVEDALTGIVWTDDAQVVTQVVRKRYAAVDTPARVDIVVIDHDQAVRAVRLPVLMCEIDESGGLADDQAVES